MLFIIDTYFFALDIEKKKLYCLWDKKMVSYFADNIYNTLQFKTIHC